jgi:hypothetical protein
MRAAIAKANRLLAAIDELSAEESIWLGAGDPAHALESHLRSLPLLAELCSVVSDPVVALALGSQLARLGDRREQNRCHLSRLRTKLLHDGHRVAGARLRLGRLSSVYGTAKNNRFRAAV